MAGVDGSYLAWTESQLQAKIESFAIARGWLYYHTFNSRRSRRGFPDVVLVHRERRLTIFAELKGPRKGKANDPTEHQEEWLRGLADAGQFVYLWRPEHWPLIMDVLSGVEAPQRPSKSPRRSPARQRSVPLQPGR